MTDERIELVDRNYGQCVETRPARQIRTRLLSFHNIKQRFNAHRISKLQAKLGGKIEKALTQGYSENDFESKIGKNATVIARLEEKIMILSKQDVPKDYVSRRAIKLRKNMIDNLTFHSSNIYGNLYSVGLENRDKVMETETEVVEEPRQEVIREVLGDNDVIRPFVEPPVSAAAIPNNDGDSNKIDVSKETLDRQSIIDSINAGFEQVQADEIHPVIEPVEKKEQVVEVEQAPIEQEKEELSVDADNPAIDKNVLKAAVEEAFEKLKAESENVPQEEVDNTKIADELVRVSKNNTTSVHADQFDDDGNRIPRPKKYNYTPMTDEEIRESQIKLGFDEHGNLVDINSTAPKQEVSKANVVGDIVIPTVTVKDAFVPAQNSVVREVPIVAPERQEKPVEFEDDVNMFDIIAPEEEVQIKPVSEEVSRTMTIDDYESLKEKILLLKKQKDESQQQKLEAQRRAQEEAVKAKEAREKYEASQASYNERMVKLRAYAASLEAACSENEKEIAAAERESKESEGIVQSQMAEANRTNQIVSEIDMMIADHPEIDRSTKVMK